MHAILLLSNVVQNAVIGDDTSVSGGALSLVTLVLVNNGVDRLAQRLEWVRVLVEGRGTAIINAGAVDDAAVSRLGFTDGEIRDALLLQGADDPGDVTRASVEPGGNIVVELEEDARPVTAGELRAAMDNLRQLLASRG